MTDEKEIVQNISRIKDTIKEISPTTKTLISLTIQNDKVVFVNNASINSKRKHPPGTFSHGRIHAPPGGKICKKTWTKPHPRGIFLSFLIQ